MLMRPKVLPLSNDSYFDPFVSPDSCRFIANLECVQLPQAGQLGELKEVSALDKKSACSGALEPVVEF